VALFDEAVAAGSSPSGAAKWLTGEVSAHLNRTGGDAGSLDLSGNDLAELVAMIDAGDLSSTAAKQVLDGVLGGYGSPREVATARDLIQIRDEGALAEAVSDVAAAHPDEIARIAEGDDKLIGFLVGQVMRATGGKADPKRVSELIRESASG
jgi:aspartyl-tRNA(Asn)/glutamyl-tRNA(Gln) amidotransferase subunit B